MLCARVCVRVSVCVCVCVCVCVGGGVGGAQADLTEAGSERTADLATALPAYQTAVREYVEVG